MSIDPDFIDSRIERGNQALEKARTHFAGLSVDVLNWKPSPKRWSVAECLHHLMVADACYFPDLEAIGRSTYRMSTWARVSPFSRLLGSAMKRQLRETVGRPMSAPGRFEPAASTHGADLPLAYEHHLQRFIGLVDTCRGADLDTTIIQSPPVPMVTYSLRDALVFLFEHEHRHLNQAIRVLGEYGR